jgi:peptidoglycan/xylan/chitin deacetylase (PgdA/CDA1 family)
MKNTRTGSIILEHDGGGDRAETVAALKNVIPRLLDKGYRFRTV